MVSRALIASFWALLSCASAHADPVSIVSRTSNKCLQVSGPIAEGSRVVQARCTGEASQLWEPTVATATMRFEIRNARGDRFKLSIGNSGAPGTPLILRSANDAYWAWGVVFQDVRDRGQSWFRLIDTRRTGATCPVVFGNPLDDGAPIALGYNRCDLPPDTPPPIADFAMVRIRLTPAPAGEPVACYTGMDGPDLSTRAGPADAVFLQTSQTRAVHGSSCVPSANGGPGWCRKWVGSCFTTTTFQPVTFEVFDDGHTNVAERTEVVTFQSTPGKACMPNGTASGLCRKWFGSGLTGDGRKVTCSLFEDGYSQITTPSDALYARLTVPSRPVNGIGSFCKPDGSATGTCHKWFGRCTAQ